MANFILSYDLNGPYPSHKTVDEHLEKLQVRGRVLETVWYVAFPGEVGDVYRYLRQVLSSNDSVFVAECSEAAWQNILVNDDALSRVWEANRSRKAA